MSSLVRYWGPAAVPAPVFGVRSAYHPSDLELTTIHRRLGAQCLLLIPPFSLGDADRLHGMPPVRLAARSCLRKRVILPTPHHCDRGGPRANCGPTALGEVFESEWFLDACRPSAVPHDAHRSALDSSAIMTSREKAIVIGYPNSLRQYRSHA